MSRPRQRGLFGEPGVYDSKPPAKKRGGGGDEGPPKDRCPKCGHHIMLCECGSVMKDLKWKKDDGEPREIKHKLPPFQRHSETSREAAVSYHGSAKALRWRVWQAIKGAAFLGHTDFELFDCFPRYSENAIRPRRVELTQMVPPLVVDSGLTRKTSSGRRATVWVTPEHKR